MLSSAIAKAKSFTAGTLSNRELLATTGSPMAAFSSVFCIFNHSGTAIKLLQHFKGRYRRVLLRVAGSRRRLFTLCGDYFRTVPYFWSLGERIQGIPMTDLPTVTPAPPQLMTSAGALLGSAGGLVYGLHKGIKVAGCCDTTKTLKYSTDMLHNTTTSAFNFTCAKCCICSGISLGGFMAAGCVGAVVLGSIGYAVAKPEQREAFRQDIISGRFKEILCAGIVPADGAHQDSGTTFRNPVFDPTDDQPETFTGHATGVVVDQPTLPAYDDLFPPLPPSYDEAVLAPEHGDDQPRQPQGSANSSTPTT